MYSVTVPQHGGGVKSFSWDGNILDELEDRPLVTRRVGMSTDPYERIEYWKRVEGHTTGTVLSSGLTYYEVQAEETRVADRDGCASSPGGAYKAGPVWSVYKVSGGATV